MPGLVVRHFFLGLSGLILHLGRYMLIQRITEDMKTAMKAGEKEKLSAIRMLRSAIKDKQIELGHEPSEKEVFVLIQKLVKQRNDAARLYAEGKRADLEAKERREAEFYQAYLPEPLSENEVEKIIRVAMDETGAASIKDMGRVMAAIRPKVQGRADMGKLSAMVKTQLSE